MFPVLMRGFLNESCAYLDHFKNSPIRSRVHCIRLGKHIVQCLHNRMASTRGPSCCQAEVPSAGPTALPWTHPRCAAKHLTRWVWTTPWRQGALSATNTHKNMQVTNQGGLAQCCATKWASALLSELPRQGPTNHTRTCKQLVGHTRWGHAIHPSCSPGL